MRKDPISSATVEVTLKSRPEYLSRLRRIAACLADSVGMDSGDAAVALTEACGNAIRHGSSRGCDDFVDIKFVASGRTLTAEIADPYGGVGHVGMGVRPVRTLSDEVCCAHRGARLAVRITKRARRVRIRLGEPRQVAL